MNVDYFIKKFRSIPEALWTTGSLYNGWTHQCCAMGFCDNTEKKSLSYFFSHYLGVRVHEINDGPPLLGGTPKARILAALEIIGSL